jgi:hypothetical protein
MNLPHSTLSSGPKISVMMTRDSVCAGDDADAPHEKTIELTAIREPAQFASAAASGYLASVAGVGHSWTCVLNGVEIAEIRVSGVRSLVSEMPFSDNNRMHFVYHSATF